MTDTRTQVRDHLVRSLEADLVGPFNLDNPDADQAPRLPPSRWYLTGLLTPEFSRGEDGRTGPRAICPDSKHTTGLTNVNPGQIL